MVATISSQGRAQGIVCWNSWGDGVGVFHLYPCSSFSSEGLVWLM